MNDKRYVLDAEELLSDKIIIDKHEAARLQLESAIKMFFYEWDVVSQHTLISAAHGIVYDLAKKQGVKGSIKDSPMFDAAGLKELIYGINFPQNFFKHANRDGGTKLTFYYKISELYLLDAIRLFVLIDGSLTKPMKVFLMWAQLRYSDLFCYELVEEDLQKIRETTTEPETFKAIGRHLLQNSEL